MRKSLFFIIALFALLSSSYANTKIDYLSWAKKIADSEMKHNPELWMGDVVKKPKWDYTQGLVAKSMMEIYKVTQEKKYFDYVKAFADFFVNENGEILTYKAEDYNIDRVNGGNFLLICIILQKKLNISRQ